MKIPQIHPSTKRNPKRVTLPKHFNYCDIKSELNSLPFEQACINGICSIENGLEAIMVSHHSSDAADVAQFVSLYANTIQSSLERYVIIFDNYSANDVSKIIVPKHLKMYY